MKTFLLAPDSFKGTLSAAEVCSVMERVILARCPDARVHSLPIADGGEGTVECFLAAAGGERVPCRVSGPLGGELESFYALLPDGTAVVEMAAAAGLPLLEGRLDPLGCTTYGVGQLIRAAVERGARRVVVGLGGSATTDGGTGAAAALGAVFRDGNGDAFLPTGETLRDIASIDISGVPTCLHGAEVVCMCDVEHPLFGPNGAAYVFSPQKGASPDQVEFLDQGLAHLSGVIARCLGRSVDALPGGGAAGGMGAGLTAFLGARLQRGIDTVLDIAGFRRLAEGADLIFTGEGKLDAQSLGGKAVLGVARSARACGVPVVAVVGGVEGGLDEVYAAGVSAVFTTNRQAVDFSVSRAHAAENLRDTMEDIMRLYLL